MDHGVSWGIFGGPGSSKSKGKEVNQVGSQGQGCIIDILKSVGVYEDCRSEFSSDRDLAITFDQDFEKLIELITNNKKASCGEAL